MHKILAVMTITSVLVSPAGADVKVIRSVSMDSMMGFGGGNKEMTVWTALDRHREEQKSEGKPTMMEKMAGLGNPVITRLDKKLRWTLNPPKKNYKESSLVTPQQASDPSSSSEDRSESGASEKPTMKITKAEFKVTPLGQKKKIGAYDCEGYQLRMVLEMEDLESHERSEMRMVSTFWNTPEAGAVAQLKKEEEAYTKAYQKTIGLDESAIAGLKGLGGAMVAAMAGAGEKELSTALAGMPAELKKIKGYPIVTRVEWYGNNPADAGSEPSAKEESPEIPTDMADALGGFAASFAKKKMEAKKPAPTADGRLMFAMTTEIKAIETGAIPADIFEVPAGFKKAN